MTALTIEQLPPDMPNANCHDLDNPDLMHPVGRDYRDAAWRAAKAVCTGCPHLTECRDWAVTHQEHGCWGGTDPGQRDALARHHGSTTSYHAGCRCDPCKDAKRADRQTKAATARAQGLPPGDPRHGTDTGWRTYGCRCTDCGALAKAAFSRKNRSRDTRRANARKDTP